MSTFKLLSNHIRQRLDKGTAEYIRAYFSHLMTDFEKLALKYHMYTSKTSENPKMKSLLTEKGWIKNDPQILELLREGYDEFELNVAKRIMSETPEMVCLNNCPKCGRLARTPYAKQCRYCGYSWRHRPRS